MCVALTGYLQIIPGSISPDSYPLLLLYTSSGVYPNPDGGVSSAVQFINVAELRHPFEVHTIVQGVID